LDEEIDGYRHRHRRSGLCIHHNRAVEHEIAMETIWNSAEPQK